MFDNVVVDVDVDVDGGIDVDVDGGIDVDDVDDVDDADDADDVDDVDDVVDDDRLRRDKLIELLFNIKYLSNDVLVFNEGKFNVV